MQRRGGLLLRLVPDYARIAWWGLVSPRVGEHGPLRIVQGVVLDGSQVLLAVRRELRGWELPGGRLAEAESDQTALAREIREETGIEVEVGQRIGEYHRTGFRPHVAHVYRCTPRSGSIEPSPETPLVRWWPQSALPATLLPWCRAPLEDAVRAGEPVVRHERNDLRQIWQAFRGDWAMRTSGDGAC